MTVTSRKGCRKHWCIHLMDFMRTKFRENHNDGHVGAKDISQSIYKRRLFYKQELFFIVEKPWSRYLWFMIYSEEYFMYSWEKCMFCCYWLEYFLESAYLINFSFQFSCTVVSDSLWPQGLQHVGLHVHHQLPEFTQTPVHWVSDAMQPSHLLLSSSPPIFNLSQHQGLFK